MSLDPSTKNPDAPVTSPGTGKPRGIRIFTYPKIIFIWPSAVAAFLCGIGMIVINDNTVDPTRHPTASREMKAGGAKPPASTDDELSHEEGVLRFRTPQNLMAIAFLLVFALNLLVMAIDFPRFTIIAMILLAAALVFFLLWLERLPQARSRRWSGPSRRSTRGQLGFLLPLRLDHADDLRDHLGRPASSTTGRSCPTRSSTTTAR